MAVRDPTIRHLAGYEKNRICVDWRKERDWAYKELRKMAFLQGDPNALEVMSILTSHYPYDLAKQKDLNVAILEVIDCYGELTLEGRIAVSEMDFIKVAEKYDVQEAAIRELAAVKRMRVE